MVSPVNNSAQAAVVNPFQQRGDEQNRTQDKKPEENRTQPAGKAAAESQSTETRNKERSEDLQRTASRRDEDRQQTKQRGSLVDLSV